ncbi:alpha/beta fold hydrolase [Acidaminobacter hydrogenoformans]|uniref:2-hydroxymuconate semialdehyde hydrolase n=1 Tax=Acidaminobacter hydrogenoformans DSM 2784 TaxID=1120920 RepID=A0A1G5RXD1_9FIRM|nr:alpha/beta hydrolase [Acidaminobacter hydrogenoformans]SCZ78567.1 2-hydroxymuconate semialdehyde hydrolase [Acidaminobacter hydrogenoformans DSM 2784]
MSSAKPEIANQVKTGAFQTNYHDQGQGFPVMLLHGSGPGVTAWANWRLVIPELAKNRRVIAPDLVGFGYTERPEHAEYNMTNWTKQVIELMDALNLEQVDLVGNSFGGGLAIKLAIEYPERIRRIVLMGSMGISFPITQGLDDVWGYKPSFENMRKMINLFAYNKDIVTDNLINLRYEASIEPGFQEAFSVMFPEPRQNGVESMASEEEKIKKIAHPALIVHGREDEVIPLENAYRLMTMIDDAQLHVFGHCGHWTQIEQTARFCKLVEDFLAE